MADANLPDSRTPRLGVTYILTDAAQVRVELYPAA
jgi:hypothetical protein